MSNRLLATAAVVLFVPTFYACNRKVPPPQPLPPQPEPGANLRFTANYIGPVTDETRLGPICVGAPLTLDVPEQRGLVDGSDIAVLFTPCGVVATGKLVQGHVTVAVPEDARSGPVWVRALNEQTFQGAYNHCLQAGARLQQLRSNAICPNIIGVSDRRGMCERLLPGPLNADRQIMRIFSQYKCALRCEALSGRAGWLTVNRKPTVYVSLDELTEVNQDAEVDGELGQHTLSWRALASPAVSSTQLGLGTTVSAVQPQDRRTFTVSNDGLVARVSASNACGQTRVALTIKPTVTVSMTDNATVFVRSDAVTTLRLTTRSRPAQPLVARLEALGSTAFTITPANVTLTNDLASGGMSGSATVSFVPGRGPPVGTIRVVMNQAAPVVPPPDLPVVGISVAPVTGSVSLTGRVRANGVAIRGARVEISEPNGPVIGIAETQADGTFNTTGVTNAANLRARVCAVNAHVQLNMENDARAYSYRCVDGPTVAVAGSTVSFSVDINAPANDVTSFRAFNDVTNSDAYVREVNPTIGEGYVRVIPCSSCYGMAAKTENRRVTDIWLPWDRLAEVSGATVRHEFGHHVENLLGTWLAWGAEHDGCYVGPTVRPPACSMPSGPELYGLAAGSQNDPVYAMFEAFPTVLANAIARDGVGTPANVTYQPATCPCPIVTYTNAHSHIIRGDAVEDYVVGVMMAILTNPPVNAAGQFVDRSGNVIVDANASGSARDEAERQLMREMLNILGHMEYPTYGRFRNRFAATFPAFDLDAGEAPFPLW
jgi:hypothetical protein